MKKINMKAVQLLALSLLLVLTFATSKVQASHYMGGEITWQCIPTGQPNAGKYIFTMKSNKLSILWH